MEMEMEMAGKGVEVSGEDGGKEKGRGGYEP
jgi:hypothetical protein